MRSYRLQSLAVLGSLVVLAGLSLFGARHRIEWHGILPVSLLALFGLMALEAGLAIAVYAFRRWTIGLAIVNAS